MWTACAVLGLLAICAQATRGAPEGFVTTYPTPPGEQASRNFSVTVNGQPVFVHNCREASYVHFAFAGQVEVKVTVSEEVRRYELSPHSYQIASAARGRDIAFTLTRPRKLILHHVNSLEEVLCIFADPPEDSAPKLGDPGVLNVLDYGVDSSGKADESERIQRAIDETPRGGVLYFPPGRYTFTRLLLKGDRSVYLAGGAVLQASEEREGQILFNEASNGRLFGRGVIDGKGYIHRAKVHGAEKGAALLRCDEGTNSRDYLIQDIVIRNAPIFHAIFFDTEDWRIENVKIVADRQFPNRDGIALHNSRNATVENVFIYTSDDPIPYSTTRPGLDLHVTVRDSVFFNNKSGACIRLGPWIGNGTRHFTAENNDLVAGTHNEFIIGIYSGGDLSDVTFRNTRVERAGYGLIRIYTDWDDYYAGKRSGSVANILFDTLIAETPGDEAGIELQATSDRNAITSITFRNLAIGGHPISAASQARMEVGTHVRGLRFEATDPTIVGVDATGLIARKSSAGEFTISRTGDTTNALTLRYRLRGTAANGADYALIGDSITIPAGASSAALAITPQTDRPPAGFATVLLTLEQGNDYMLGPNFQAQVTIFGDRDRSN